MSRSSYGPRQGEVHSVGIPVLVCSVLSQLSWPQWKRHGLQDLQSQPRLILRGPRVLMQKLWVTPRRSSRQHQEFDWIQFFNFNTNWELNVQGWIKRIKQVVKWGTPQVLWPKAPAQQASFEVDSFRPTKYSVKLQTSMRMPTLGSVSATSYQGLMGSTKILWLTDLHYETRLELTWWRACGECEFGSQHLSSVAHNLRPLQIWKISYSLLLCHTSRAHTVQAFSERI